ncbi:MAG TPA: serine protease [Syntrophobacteraceae bacterium]|nr:serine protease [Syntrophobacteraceae bacterium]
MHTTHRFRLIGLVILGLIAVGTSSGLAADHVNLVSLQDSINPGTKDFLERAIALSVEDQAECLVILLDTPGGLMTTMRSMVQAIMNAPLPIVVYVYPSGAQAASAGVLITIAADFAAMAPGTNIGAAHPVSGSGDDIPKTMNEKVLNDFLAFSRSVATERGRNVEWVAKAIRESASITADEAYSANVIDCVAANLDDLMARMDGYHVERKGFSKTLHVKGLERRTLAPGWRDQLLRIIGDPSIAYLLLMVGLAGLYFELSHPGTIFPGVIGGISLVAAAYALQKLPVNYAGFLFILLAVICFILEIKVASYGMLSLAGVLSLVIGSVMLFRVPGEVGHLSLSVLVPTVGVISAFFVTVATLAFRAQMRKPTTGMEGLLGTEGETRTELKPEGKVFVEGELWNAYADEPIPRGVKVRVMEIRDLKLKVQRIDVR